MLEDTKFRGWMNSSLPTPLWVYGGSGTGKTFLATHVVQHLQNQGDAGFGVVSYFFLDKSDASRCSLASVTASIISQILLQSQEISPALETAFKNSRRFGRNKMSQLDNPRSLLMSMVADLDRLSLVVDGCDEGEHPGELLTALMAIGESSANLHLSVFSRDIPQIRTVMKQAIHIPLAAQNTRKDIHRYVKSASSRLKLCDPVLEQEIVDVVTSKAEGMFLWAARVMQSLQAAATRGKIFELLNQLPPGMDEYYERCLKSISEEQGERRWLSETVLKWTCCVMRPMTWSEIYYGLKSLRRQGDGRSHEPLKNLVLDLCAAFLTYDDVTDTLQFQHLSAREFLTTAQALPYGWRAVVDTAETNHDIAVVCLECLLDPSWNSEFTRYATLHWLEHVLASSPSPRLRDNIASFYLNKGAVEKWLHHVLLWANQGSFATSVVLGSQQRLNEWMQSESPISNLEIDWTEPLVQVLLKADDPTGGELDCRKLSLGHFEKLMIVRDIARVLTQTGRLDEGVRWFEDALDQFSIADPAIARYWIMSTLGILYDQRGEIDRSLEVHHQVRDHQEANLGDKHLETLWTVNEMGRVYRHLGDYSKAEEAHETALASLGRILPHDHLEVVWTINTLARAYRKNGKLEEALRCHRIALEQQERALGTWHPNVMWTMGDIGKCYFGLGQIREAEQYHSSSWEKRKLILGAAHVDTLWSMSKLGQVLGAKGRLSEGVSLLQGALKRQMLCHGEQHPQTRKTAAVLHCLVADTERLSPVDTLIEEA